MSAQPGNKYAEKYDEQTASDLFDSAIELAKTGEYDFIGEIAMELNTSHKIFNYLSNKFQHLKENHDTLMAYVEASCFRNAKRGKIKDSLAIVNLKSNHGWTDRQRIDNNITGAGFKIVVNDPEMKDEIKRMSDRTD